MDIFSWVLAAVAIITLIVWMFVKSSIWIAVTATLILFFLASLGWLWWWVPIVAASITLIGILIALIRSAVFGRRMMIAVTVAGLLVGLGASGVQWGWFTAGPASASGGVDTIAFDPSKDAIPAEAKCDTNLFVDHSLRTVEVGNLEKKQFGTAVSIPLTGVDDKSVMTEMTKTEICGNPTVLEMVVKDMLSWNSSEIPGADDNKGWLNEIEQTIASAPSGLNSFIANKAKESDPWTVTETYQKYAAWVNTVLLRSKAEGQQSLTSVRNWELSASVDPSKGLPSAQQAAVQENKPAWVRSYIDKQGNCLLRFGFNTEDRRFEVFDCKTPTPEAPPSEGNPPPGTPEVPNQPPSGCTENCSPPPPPCNPQEEKCWDSSVNAPDGVSVQPNDPYEERPNLPADPAPVLPSGTTPNSNSGAPGATNPDPNREQPPAGTGTTPGGGTGGVNPNTGGGTNNGTNTTDPGNPFG